MWDEQTTCLRPSFIKKGPMIRVKGSPGEAVCRAQETVPGAGKKVLHGHEIAMRTAVSSVLFDESNERSCGVDQQNFTHHDPTSRTILNRKNRRLEGGAGSAIVSQPSAAGCSVEAEESKSTTGFDQLVRSPVAST